MILFDGPPLLSTVKLLGAKKRAKMSKDKVQKKKRERGEVSFKIERVEERTLLLPWLPDGCALHQADRIAVKEPSERHQVQSPRSK